LESSLQVLPSRVWLQDDTYSLSLSLSLKMKKNKRNERGKKIKFVFPTLYYFSTLSNGGESIERMSEISLSL
jgi:hypothetical protein